MMHQKWHIQSRLLRCKKWEACISIDGLHRRKEGISEALVDMLHLQFRNARFEVIVHSFCGSQLPQLAPFE